MRSMQKILSSSLAALMIAGCGTAVFAKDFSDIDDFSFAKKEIDMLSDIGVIRGTSENEYSPDETVTREQMAAFLFRLMLNKDDAGRVNTTKFTDLYESYYNGVISWANASGYIRGTSETTFEPTGGITMQDAMAMLVRALGQETENMNAGYPWSYINAGIKLGLDRDLEDLDYDETMTREEMAVLLYNALTAEYLVSKTTNNGNLYYKSTSLIEEVFGYSLADAVIIGTNNYTTGSNTVVKKDHVTLQCTDSDGRTFSMTVPYADMHLEGSANSMLGHSLKVIYQTNGNKHTVLSAVEMSESEDFTEVTVGDNDTTVTIGENKYTLVSSYSDELDTNNNELMLYAYDDNGTLEKIQNISELKPLLGFYRVTLIYDNDEDIARRAVLRGYELGHLDIDSNGKINLAGGLKQEELTGGYANPHKAQSGDYVLYYYNSGAKDLEIGAVLEMVNGTVRRITGSTVQIEDTSYKLGNTTAGISAESILEQIQLGSKVNAVVYKGAVIAIHKGIIQSARSEYLVTLSDAHRIYENGTFRYVAEVSVNGETKNVYLQNGSAAAGQVYRYTVTNGVYTLIAPQIEEGLILSGSNAFIQQDKNLHEIAYILTETDGTTITLNGRNHFTLNPGQSTPVASIMGMNNVSFVTNADTLIVVNSNGSITTRKGTYNSTVQIEDGASVTAIFDNETGSVETLRYLYISDGTLGNYDVNAEYVRVLAVNGSVLQDGKAYIEYTVYNFGTNSIETRLSEIVSLTVGEDYRTGSDGCITTETAEHIENGFVTGYTASTVTINGTTYSLAENVNIITLNGNKVSAKKMSDLYMRHVEFVTVNGEVSLVIDSKAPAFTAEAEGSSITVTPDFDIRNFDVASLSLTGVKLNNEEADHENMSLSFAENGTIVLEAAEALTPGKYTVTFALGGSTFVVNAELEAPAQSENA